MFNFTTMLTMQLTAVS